MNEMSPESIAALREALDGYTVDAAHDLLGDEAWHSLARNETVPARRATADGSALSTFIRVFQLGMPVSSDQARAAFGTSYTPLLEAGLLIRDGADIGATVEIRPYGDETHDWWVVSDMTLGLDGRPVTVGSEYVLGISEASSSLAQMIAQEPASSALDLGTGCGVQSLHLSTLAQQVVATDVNPRALQLTKLTMALNEISLDVRSGSLYEPVVGERFDVIATNPPFVVSPPSAERLVYRETDFAADDVVRYVVEGASEHLNPGGRCHILAAWIHRSGQDWQDRLGSWLDGTGLDAWVVQREVLDLSSYAEMWLADAGIRHRPDYVEQYDRWLDWLAGEGIEAMGFGWLNLRRSDRQHPDITLEDATWPLAGPIAPEITARAERIDVLASADPLDRLWQLGSDVVQETLGQVGADDPSAITVRRTTGLQRARAVDTVEAALLGAADGDLTPRQLLTAIAELLEIDVEAVIETTRLSLEAFIREGFLVPAS